MVTTDALLVMDVQRAVVERYPDPGYLPRVGEAIAAARAGGLPVIYVVVGFRPGYPEVSARNRIFGRLAALSGTPGGEEAMQIHPDVAPVPGDIVVTKRRVSAFAGSDLDVVLRAGGIEHLVLAGIATSGVVLSTLRQAADLDFDLTVLSDACLDSDPEVHRVLTEKVFPRQADVVTVADWAAKP
jgi:nicotinamidase-related amidase